MGLFTNASIVKRAFQNVDSKEKPSCDLRIPLQVRRLVRKKGLQCTQTRRTREHPQPPSHQGYAVTKVKRICQGKLRMEALLLFLNDEGIEFLRKELHLPPEIVPATLRRQPKPDTARARPRASEPRSPSGRESDRDP